MQHADKTCVQSNSSLKMSGRYFLCVSLFLAVGGITKVLGTLHVPNRYTLHEGLQSVNGSDRNGSCPDIQDCIIVRDGCICDDNPAAGVLIDGVVPTIDPVSDVNWASGLFTLSTSGLNSIAIGFLFRTRFNLKRVELNFFNCHAWNIGATTITVYTDTTFPNFLNRQAIEIGSIDVGNKQSCSTLTRVSIPVTINFAQRNIYYLQFSTPSTEWVHIAEAKFSDETSTTPIPTTPPTSTDHSTTTIPTTTQPQPSFTTTATTTSTDHSTTQSEDTATSTSQDGTKTTFETETKLPLTTSLTICDECETTTLGESTVETDSTSSFNPTLIVLVIVFTLGFIILIIILILVSVRLRIYYKKSTQTPRPAARQPATERIYDDIINMDDRHSIEMTHNKAYDIPVQIRSSETPIGDDGYSKVI